MSKCQFFEQGMWYCFDTRIFVFCFLTVDSKGDLGLPDSDPRDDGFAHVLAGIGLAHGLQIQLVAVTQNLEGVEENTQI